MDAICTNLDMVEGGIDLKPTKCPICCKISEKRAGYIGVYCFNCKRILTGDEWSGQIARQRREILGLTKKQIGDKLGLSKHTVHAYEWKKCPEKYLDQLEEIMNQND